MSEQTHREALSEVIPECCGQGEVHYMGHQNATTVTGGVHVFVCDTCHRVQLFANRGKFKNLEAIWRGMQDLAEGLHEAEDLHVNTTMSTSSWRQAFGQAVNTTTVLGTWSREDRLPTPYDSWSRDDHSWTRGHSG